MLAYSSYIQPKKKKIIISDKDAVDNLPNEKLTISNKHETFLDEYPSTNERFNLAKLNP